jgi:hypothetical protein
MSQAVQLHRDFERSKARPKDDPPDAIPRRMLHKRRDPLAKEAHVLGMVNNAGGRAPPLVLKRQEQPMASITDLIKSADALIRSGDLNGAEHALDRALAKQNHFHFYGRDNSIDDDEDDFESPSDPSNDSDDDEDDNGNGKMKKADEHYHFPHYGSTPSPQTASGHGTGPNQSSDPYATGSWSTAGTPSKTAFDGRVDMVMARDQVTRAAAMTRARNEFPKDYQEHQASLVAGPTRDQHARRSSAQATKRAPTTFYEDLVSEQMAKGCNYEMAAQRVCQAHGYDAFNNRMLAKGSHDIEARFARIVKSLSYEHDISMEEATRLARKRNPSLYKAMNSI